MATAASVFTGTIGASVSSTLDLGVGFGAPTAALIILSEANTGSNPQSNAALSFGIWSASAQRSAGYFSRDASNNATRQQKTGVVAVRPSQTAGQFFELTAAVAPGSDGLRLTVSYSDSSVSRYVTAILFKGTTNVGMVDVNLGTGTSAIDVTSLGFRPHFLCAIGAGGSSNINLTQAIISIGFAHNDGTTTTQGFVGAWSEDSVATSDTGVYVGASHIGGQVFNGTASWLASVSDFDANGFSITPSANAASDVLYIVALELADANDAYVGVVDSKTTTGTQAYTGTGFTPQVLGLLQTLCTATGTVTRTNSLSVGATDGTRSRVVSVRDRDAVASPSADSQSADSLLLIRNGDGTDDAAAAYSSFDSDGWTLNYSDGSASVRKMLAFAIGDSTAGGYTHPTLSAATLVPAGGNTYQPRVTYTF
jgi:hypothetical protein